MGLNWTIEVILNLISVIPYFVSMFILGRLYIKHHDRIILAFIFTWLSYGIYWLSNAIAYLLLSKDLFRINKILLIISAFSFIISQDFINRERIEPLKLSIFTLLGGGLIFAVFQPDSVEQIKLDNGDDSLQNVGLNRIMMSLIAIGVIIVYLYYTYKIYKNSSDKYHKFALLHLIGAITFGPITLVMFLFEISVHIPGTTPLVSSLGILLSSYAISKSPQLIYILPFKVYNLQVIEHESGITLFSHQWHSDESDVPELLFSSVLESINIFAQEVLNRGIIQEIKLDTDIIMIQVIPGTNLYTTLLASDSSPVLKENLLTFSKLFSDRFDFSGSEVTQTSKFISAVELIPLAFPYIPEQID